MRAFRSDSVEPAASVGPAAPADLEALDWKSLYRKSKYEVRTRDGWTLVVTRYQPTPQIFVQPIRGEPLLLVHGFSQNRHAWTCGGFVKHMLYYGADVHVLELRGHGLSSVELQRRKAAADGTPLPADLNYAWDIDTYFLEDLPAAIAEVKRRTGRDRIFYCGHSLGGMLGYGYATLERDLAGLVTIGAPADPGKGYLGVRLLAHFGPVFERALDAALLARWLRRSTTWRLRQGLHHAVSRVRRRGRRLVGTLAQGPERLRFEYYPFDVVLRHLDRALGDPRVFDGWERVARARLFPFLANPSQVTLDAVRWLLREGGEREPRKVVAQLWRWTREGRLCCYRTGYDFRASFSKIRIPMAIIFGDLDPLAGIDSTREVYRKARSEYLLWRPVKGNSHVELTMGRDVRQISFDVKNLIAYARTFPAARPATRRTTTERSPDDGVTPVAPIAAS